MWSRLKCKENKQNQAKFPIWGSRFAGQVAMIFENPRLGQSKMGINVHSYSNQYRIQYLGSPSFHLLGFIFFFFFTPPTFFTRFITFPLNITHHVYYLKLKTHNMIIIYVIFYNIQLTRVFRENIKFRLSVIFHTEVYQIYPAALIWPRTSDLKRKVRKQKYTIQPLAFFCPTTLE